MHEDIGANYVTSTAHIPTGKVCRAGNSSGTTFGDVSADQFVLLNQKRRNGKPSMDWIVTNGNGEIPFGTHGDSGAWVLGGFKA